MGAFGVRFLEARWEKQLQAVFTEFVSKFGSLTEFECFGFRFSGIFVLVF